MHRIPLAAVVSASALVLAACGGGGSGGGGSGGGESGGDEQLSVVYVPGLTGNPFYSTVGCGGRDKAKETPMQAPITWHWVTPRWRSSARWSAV